MNQPANKKWSLLFFAFSFFLVLPTKASEVFCRDIKVFRPKDKLTVQALNWSDRAQIQSMAHRIIDIAEDLYFSAERNQQESIFPIQQSLIIQLYQNDAKTGFSQVARNSEGEIVGFGLAQRDPETGLLILEKLAIVEEYQGQGLASQILHSMALVAKAQGVHAMELLVRKGNTKAIQIYEHMGFRNPFPGPNDGNAFLYIALIHDLLKRTAP